MDQTFSVGFNKFNFNSSDYYRRHHNYITNSFKTIPSDLLDYYNKCRLTAKAYYGKSKQKFNNDFLCNVYEKINRKINFVFLDKETSYK